MSEEPPTDESEMLSPEWIEARIDELVVETLIKPEWRDTARVVFYAFKVGTNPDKIAQESGVNRDFVRAKAKVLRENGIFLTEPMTPGRISVSDTEGDREFQIELTLMVMCAEGLVRHVTEPEPQDAPSASQ